MSNIRFAMLPCVISSVTLTFMVIYFACAFGIQVQTVNMGAFCACETLMSQLQEGSMSPCKGSRRQRLRIDVGQTCCKKVSRKINMLLT